MINIQDELIADISIHEACTPRGSRGTPVHKKNEIVPGAFKWLKNIFK